MMLAVASQDRTKPVASASISANNCMMIAGRNADNRMNTDRLDSKLNGARKKPMADPTPAPCGIRQRSTPSFSHSRAACRGAAPPNAIMVYSERSSPFSTACTRAALAMFSSTTSARPKAASTASISSRWPKTLSSACRASAVESGMVPPAKPSGSSLPKIRSASVTAGRRPPRP